MARGPEAVDQAPTLPSPTEMDQLTQRAMSVIDVPRDDIGWLVGGAESWYEPNPLTIMQVGVSNYRNTSPERPDLDIMVREYVDEDGEEFTETDLTLGEADPPLFRKIPLHYTVVTEPIKVLYTPERRVTLSGPSLLRTIDRLKKVRRGERQQMKSLAESSFDKSEYDKLMALLENCTPDTQLHEDGV